MTRSLRCLLVVPALLAVFASTAFGQVGAAPKPLASAEKKFIKDAAEQMIVEIHLLELNADVKKANTPMWKDLRAAWGELATVAQEHKMELPETEASSAEKALLKELQKMDKDKLWKAFYKELSKETKKTGQVFENASKTVQDPALKAYLGKWAPVIAKHHTDVEAAEDAAKKAK